MIWEDGLPPTKPYGDGTVSGKVKVLLSDGTVSEDWLINDKWVVHCKTNGGAFPIVWRYE